MHTCGQAMMHFFTTSISVDMSHYEIFRVKVTVNSENFVQVLFSRNFAYAELRKNKALAKWRKLFLSFTNESKSCKNRNFLTWLICLLTLFAEISEFTAVRVV